MGGTLWGHGPALPKLTRSLRCDVCVIGAGIAGLSVAYQLARAGRKVVVLERERIGAGETHHTTAHLASAFDDRYTKMERVHGREGARRIAQSHSAAIDEIERIAYEEDIACDFKRVDGYLFLGREHTMDYLERELAASRRAGLRVEMVERAPIDYDTGPALRYADQARVHPIKYLTGLAKAIRRRKGMLYRAHATEIAHGEPAQVITAQGRKVTAGAVVLATNVPINRKVSVQTKQAPYRTYVIAASVPAGLVTDALYWDTEDPYHYVRLQPMSRGRRTADMLIVGGADHRHGEADDAEERFDRLQRWAKERFPAMRHVEHRWSGEVIEPVDGVGMIGRSPGMRNSYLATGDSGQGMTHGTIAGMLIADLILGRRNPWAKLYSPSRISLRSLGTYAKDNLQASKHYAALLTAGEVASAGLIPRESGAVLRQGGQKLAAYRDERGRLHVRSAVCTHMGCVVAWNDAEKAWDCPCHGSRFGPKGEVMRGPAVADLEDVERDVREQVTEKAKGRSPA